MSIDLDAFREQSRHTWAEMAAGWEARHDWLMDVTGPVNDWMVSVADPQPGLVYLDIAAGTGDLGFELAERVGPDGRVISSDFAAEMVDAARRFGAARGATNVDYRVLDAERMDLDDDCVDGAVCRWGYMLMADPAAALSETRRVLRDGGALTFVVFTAPDRNPWVAIPATTLVQHGHMPPPQPGDPGILALGDPSRVRELVTGAEFSELELEEIAFAMRYADFDDLWDALTRLAGPLAHVVNALPPDELEATREAIRDAVESFRSDTGSYVVPASSWGVHAR